MWRLVAEWLEHWADNNEVVSLLDPSQIFAEQHHLPDMPDNSNTTINVKPLAKESAFNNNSSFSEIDG